MLQPVQRQQVKQLVAGVKAPVSVHHLQAVGVAIQRNANVRAMLAHGLLQGLRMRGAHAVVDVQAVRLVANGDDFGPQLVKNGRGDLVGRAVGGVHHDLQPAQAQIRAESAFAELDVAARRVVQPARAAQRGRFHPLRGFLQRRFHLLLPFVGQLGAIGAEKLDAVVGVAVVAGADDHAQAGALRSREVGHGGRGHGAEQQRAHASGVQARFERAFQHVAGNARVFANEHERAA